MLQKINIFVGLQVRYLCNGSPDCVDGSDEMCSHECVPEAFEGKYTMKVGQFLTH